MYQYDKLDREITAQRSAQFREQVERYLGGSLDAEEFQQLRLRNGLYQELHAPMLRVAIPYGMLAATQLRALADVADKYDHGYGHFTTRQNIQFNWPSVQSVPDLLDDLNKVDMHAIQTSGNVVRNITCDALAGISDDEIEDPRPWCELLRQWALLHPEFNWLPRKFKIAVSGARRDRAAVRFHDIGLQLVHDDAGDLGFKVWVGGGLGRTPFVGQVINEFLPGRDLLAYVEAILRIYNLHGRRDNKHRARIKILVNTLGIAAMRERVESEWLRIRDGALRLTERDIAHIKGRFTRPDYLPHAAAEGARLKFDLEAHPDFARWYRYNTRAHKHDGYRIVWVSLKGPDVAPGDLTSGQMRMLARFVDRYSGGELRVEHTQNLILGDVKQADLLDLWHGLDTLGLARANIGTLTDMICCPGADYCSLANAGTLNVSRAINERFDDLDYLYDLGEVSLKISGCMNACGHHHIGHIGVLGVEKQGGWWYQITLGGSGSNEASLGERLGPAVPRDQIAEAVARILQVYVNHRLPGESFLSTCGRLGIAPFKTAVYAKNKAPGEQDAVLAA